MWGYVVKSESCNILLRPLSYQKLAFKATYTYLCKCYLQSEDLNSYCLHLYSVVPQKVGPPTLSKAASSGKPALTVTWTAPQSDRPITKYQVQYRRTGTSSWSARDVTIRSLTLTVGNLSPGATYQFQVRAVSDVGIGPFSDVRTLLTFRGTYVVCIVYTITV